ncbi:hypothetical protein [Altibacter lentus]|uniref:hypothetical protein n=1 Tax=Altibacter lentus TaxID=1223410 RepID=UPI0005571466|nr:hypothetical protein [Altibacter lentus]MCT8339054.1 hypothetical protein [Thermobacterium salinum]
MKEKNIKKTIQKSELKTKTGFTDDLMSAIENEQIKEKPIKFWSVGRIIIGFILFTVVSGFIVYNISFLLLPNGGVSVPFVWSLILLLGLSYILSMNKYKSSYSSEY